MDTHCLTWYSLILVVSGQNLAVHYERHCSVGKGNSRFMFMLGVLYMKCMKSWVVLMRIWSPLYRMERYHHVPYDTEGKMKKEQREKVRSRRTTVLYNLLVFKSWRGLTTTTGRMTIKASPYTSSTYRGKQEPNKVTVKSNKQTKLRLSVKIILT